MKSPIPKSWLVWILKLGFTAFLLWLALHRVPLGGLRDAFLRIDRPGALLSAVVFLAGCILAESLRLRYAGRLVQERQPSFLAWARIYSESRPFFYLLPAAVGAEGVVWLRLRSYAWRHASCGFTVLLVRVTGVAGWALAAGWALRAPGGTTAILAGTPALLRTPMLWWSGGTFALAASFLAPRLAGRYLGISVAGRRILPLVSLTASTAFSLLVCTLTAQMAATAAHVPLGILQTAGLIALFNFAMVLPISLGGFGLQEALVLRMGVPMGCSPAALLAFSAILHAQRLLLALVGGVVFLGSPAVAEREKIGKPEPWRTI